MKCESLAWFLVRFTLPPSSLGKFLIIPCIIVEKEGTKKKVMDIQVSLNLTLNPFSECGYGN